MHLPEHLKLFPKIGAVVQSMQQEICYLNYFFTIEEKNIESSRLGKNLVQRTKQQLSFVIFGL